MHRVVQVKGFVNEFVSFIRPHGGFDKPVFMWVY